MIIYAAVRMVDGEEIPSKRSASHSRYEVEAHCRFIKERTPEWNSKYPVVRIATFRCEEI